MKINTNIDIQIKSSKVKIILVAGFIILLLFFIGYQFYVYFGKRPAVATSTAIYQTIYKDVTTDGFVVRSEQYVTNTNAGTVVPAVVNGSKVTKGDVVAKAYTSEAYAKNNARLLQLEKDIDYYESVGSAASGTLPADISQYKAKVFSAAVKLTDAIDENNMSNISVLSDTFREALTKKQIVCGVSVDVSQTLAALKTEYESLSQSAGGYTAIAADAPGFYYNTTDGYENAVPYETVREMGISDVDRLLALPNSPVASDVEGKLITEYNWYIVCNISYLDGKKIEVGDALTVNFTGAAVDDLRMIVAAVNEDESAGKTTIVLRSNYMNEAIASLRKCTIKIRFEQHSGYIIDPRSVRTVDGEKGVFIYLRNQAKFRKINIVYSDENIILADGDGGKEGYISQYDEVLLEGTDLYDGKVIS